MVWGFRGRVLDRNWLAVWYREIFAYSWVSSLGILSRFRG